VNDNKNARAKSTTSNKQKESSVIEESSPIANIYCQMATRLFEMLSLNDLDNLQAKTSNVGEKLAKVSLLDNKSLFSEENKSVNVISKNNLYKASSTNSNSLKNALSTSNNKTISLNDVLKKRTTLKEELVISNQFQNKIPEYFNRKNYDLMRIVEDQV
jgi:hypothetical protein